MHTGELPSTPDRTRRIPADAWVEAPRSLHDAATGLPAGTVVSFLRRIGPWLLWRAGPARGPARYWAASVDDLDRSFTLDLHADGTASGTGPSGQTHTRFRTWKEDLRDAGR